MKILHEWDDLIRTANEAVITKNNAKAIPHFYKALKLALAHFESHFLENPTQALTLVMYSHLGIAQTYASMRRYPVAVRQFNRCFHFFNTLLLRTDLNADVQMEIQSSLQVLEQDWKKFNEPLQHLPLLRDHILAVETVSPHIRQCH